jgi:hypothetical protein
MVMQPIKLPGKAAGLDIRMAGGLTLSAAERVNCQGDPQGDAFGDCTLVVSWGDNGEVWFDYQPWNGVGLTMTLWAGYLGTLNFKDPGGTHTYQIGILSQILKDGQPFTLATGWSGATFDNEVDELYRGLLATFAPQIPLDAAGVTCMSTKKCTSSTFGTIAYIDIPSLGFAFWVDNYTAAQPIPSTPTRIDLFH